MSEKSDSIKITFAVGFGTRIVTLHARTKGLAGHDLITPIRAVSTETGMTQDELAEDIHWGLLQAKDLWGIWSTPAIDGNPALDKAREELGLRAKQSSGRAAEFKMKSFGMKVSAANMVLYRFERLGNGWGGVHVEQIELGDFPKITPAALKKLATKCAAIAFPHLDGAPPLPADKPAKRGKA
jgi:hypothetical protein